MCLHYSEKNIREKVERQNFVSHSVYRVDDTDIPVNSGMGNRKNN